MHALRFCLVGVLLFASVAFAKPKCCKPRKRPDCDPSITGNSENQQNISGSEQHEYFESNSEEESTLEITGSLNCPPCNAAAERNDVTETMVMTPEAGSGHVDDENIHQRPVSGGSCENFDCPNPPCQVFCELEHGYYPDPRDCRNFCFCSGNVEIPSKYQRCAGGLREPLKF